MHYYASSSIRKNCSSEDCCQITHKKGIHFYKNDHEDRSINLLIKNDPPQSKTTYKK